MMKRDTLHCVSWRNNILAYGFSVKDLYTVNFRLNLKDKNITSPGRVTSGDVKVIF